MSSVVRERSEGRPLVAESESAQHCVESSGKQTTDREAVEFACFVLAELGIEGLNAEIFRRASIGRGEDICPVLWKALHDILILHTKTHFALLYPLPPEAHVGQKGRAHNNGMKVASRLRSAWASIVESGSQPFKFSTVVSYVRDQLVLLGCPEEFVGSLVDKDGNNDDSRGLLLALCFCIAKFSILEEYTLSLYTAEPVAKQVPKRVRADQAEVRRKEEVEIKKDRLFWKRVPLPFRTHHAVNVEVADERSTNFSNVRPNDFPAVYENVRRELRDSMCSVRNAYARLGRALDSVSAISAGYTKQDPYLELNSPLALGLFVHSLQTKSPKRVDRMMKVLLANCRAGNHAMNLSIQFWRWCQGVQRSAAPLPLQEHEETEEMGMEECMRINFERLERAFSFIEERLGYTVVRDI